jgi:putative oxidoreductase
MSEGVQISAGDLGKVAIRLGIGGLFAFHHGWQKLTAGSALWEKLGGSMGQLGIHFWPTFWGFLAMFGEFGGGLLFLLGLFFRPACAMLAFVMFMATLTMLHNPPHGWAPLDAASHPITAGAAVLGMLLMGPGKISLKEAIRPLRTKWYG